MSLEKYVSPMPTHCSAVPAQSCAVLTPTLTFDLLN